MVGEQHPGGHGLVVRRGGGAEDGDAQRTGQARVDAAPAVVFDEVGPAGAAVRHPQHGGVDVLVQDDQRFGPVVERGAQHALVVGDGLPGGAQAFDVEGAVPEGGELLDVAAGVGLGVGEEFALERGRGEAAGGAGAGQRVGEQVGEPSVGEGVVRCAGVVDGEPERVVAGAESLDAVPPGRGAGVVDGEVVEGGPEPVRVQWAAQLQDGRVVGGLPRSTKTVVASSGGGGAVWSVVIGCPGRARPGGRAYGVLSTRTTVCTASAYGCGEPPPSLLSSAERVCAGPPIRS